jgi:regulatory protein
MEKTITAITPQKKNSRRVNIFLDGEFAFGISNTVAAWLRVGQKLDEKKVDDLISRDEREVAFQRAMHYSGYRMRSEKEMEDKLTSYGYGVDVISDVMTRLRSLSVIDDQAFAGSWVENRVSFHPRSKRQIAYELRHKGIADEIITTVLSNTADENQLAYRIGMKYASRLKDAEWEIFRKKLGSYLLRKGFSYEIVKAVTVQIWEEHGNTN